MTALGGVNLVFLAAFLQVDKVGLAVATPNGFDVELDILGVGFVEDTHDEVAQVFSAGAGQALTTPDGAKAVFASFPFIYQP